MPKKKKIPVVSEPDETLENIGETHEPAFAGPVLTPDQDRPQKPESEPKRKGVFLPFNEDGSIDVKRLKGDDWKLDAARKALAMSPDASSGKLSAGLTVSEDFVRGLYSGFELALQRAGVFFLKWPVDLAHLMKYSDDQKNKLVPPTKAVIEKLAPRWLIEHQEIATLAVILTTETTAMVQNALAGYVLMHPELFQPVKPNGRDAGTEPRETPQAA